MVFRELSRVLFRSFKNLPTINYLKQVVLQTEYLEDIQNYLKTI